MTTSPADFALAQLVPGLRRVQPYEVSSEVYEGFLAVFGDRSPIHVDDAHARGRGFAGRVMHGAILHGFLSHFVGMCLPGRRALLLSVDLRYVQPVYLGDRVRLEGEVRQVVSSERLVVLDVRFVEAGRDELVARGRVRLRVDDDV